MEKQKKQFGLIVRLFERLFAYLHFISPAKWLAKAIKHCWKEKKSYGFLSDIIDIYVLSCTIVSCILLGFAQVCREQIRLLAPRSIIGVLLTIRLVEIAGVTMDVLVFDRMRAQSKGKDYFIVSPERTFLLGVINYFEIMLYFALIYFIFFSTQFAGVYNRQSIWDSLYFSILTITTLGYGDIQPKGALLRIVSVIEALVGVLALALIVTRGVSLLRSPDASNGVPGSNVRSREE